MYKEKSRREVYKIVYPRGSFDGQLPDSHVLQPVDGDGWSLEDAEDLIKGMSDQMGLNSNDFSLVNSFGKEVPLSQNENQK